MTLQQLKYIVEIVKCGSFNAASKKLFVTQPNLSNAVKELEDELKIQIFERSNRGISLSLEGKEFIKYAIDLVDKSEHLYQVFTNNKKTTHFSISSQHYSFVVDAYIKLLNQMDSTDYQMYLRENKTMEIIEDVYQHKSELGILFLSPSNQDFLKKMLNYKNLEFLSLKKIYPHVFLSSEHPLSKREVITLDDLQSYPYVSYEQGENHSISFCEEVMAQDASKKTIYVQDRATMQNIIAKTNSYTIGTGYIVPHITDSHLISIPLETNDYMDIGYIKTKDSTISQLGKNYLELLEESITQYEKID